jgi:hypothetical protein
MTPSAPSGATKRHLRKLSRFVEQVTLSHQGLGQDAGLLPAPYIVPTPSGKLQARVKCPTLAGQSGEAKLQTPSAKFQLLGFTQLALDPEPTWIPEPGDIPDTVRKMATP